MVSMIKGRRAAAAAIKGGKGYRNGAGTVPGPGVISEETTDIFFLPCSYQSRIQISFHKGVKLQTAAASGCLKLLLAA